MRWALERERGGFQARPAAPVRMTASASVPPRPARNADLMTAYGQPETGLAPKQWSEDPRL
jgi:hypothetical protein